MDKEMKVFHHIFRAPTLMRRERTLKDTASSYKLDLIQQLLNQRKNFRMAVLCGVILIKGELAPAEFVATFQSLNQSVLFIKKHILLTIKGIVEKMKL